MQIVYPYCAGLDVQKKTVVACCITPRVTGDKCSKTRNFDNTTYGLLALSDWLSSNSVTHVALDNTGKFWHTLYHLLQANFEVLPVDVHRLMDVPGRKATMKDAEWIADLMLHGLLLGSFIHPLPRRTLQDLTRHRHNLVQERTSVVDRLHKLLDAANVKMASVVSDVMQISTLSMLVKMAEVQTDASTIVDLAKKSLQQKQQESEQAYFKRIREHHHFLIANYLSHIEFLDKQITVFNSKITEYMQAQKSQSAPSATEAKQPIQEVKKNDTSQNDPLFASWEEAWEAFLKGGRDLES